MRQEAATLAQHGSLKTLAVGVLERNTAARQACNTAPDDVLQRDATHDATMQHSCDTPEPPSRSPQCPGPEVCAGCYSVGVIDGRERFIHPPKASPEWKAWLERWQPKGKVQ